jgi:ferredoxin-type protein NapG
MDRRDFVARTAQGAAAAACGALAWTVLVQQQARAAPRLKPPGALADDDFAARCIKCGQCVQACPYDTLHLVRAGEAGLVGTPTYVPRQAPCVMCEPIHCAKACPTGALDAALPDIRAARMGLAVVDPEHCLSWQGLRCELCYRVCPAKGTAITVATHPRQISRHAMFVPVVHSDLCTGCGVCEQKCPTDLASIRVVDPRLVQGRIGSHYRLARPGEDRAIEGPAAVSAPVSAETPPGAAGRVRIDGVVPPPTRPAALDYLNRSTTP